MAQVILNINYREYPVSCENGEEAHIIKLGRILDEKAKALTAALGHINESQLLAMVGLIIADELSELKKNANQPTPAPAPQPATMTTENYAEFDKELAETINYLNDTIKSIATKLNSF